MKKIILLLAVAFGQLIFSFGAQADDPIYTGIFSNKALDGYDTVAYFTDGKPVKGTNRFKTTYMGADWYFSSQENLNKFVSNPQAFAPQYGGYCAWAIAEKNDFAPGDPEQWKIVDGKLYLNYNADIQKRWLKDVPGFIQAGNTNWPKLISQ